MNKKQISPSIAVSYEKDYWDRRSTDYVAWIYDLYGNFPLAQLIQKHYISLRGAKRILEIGCGGLGVGLLWLFPNAELRIGLDILNISKIPSSDVPLFRELIICARKGVIYIKGSGESIPHPIGFFDLIICNNVLDHVSYPQKVPEEVSKSLKPEGIFCFAVDCSSWWGLFYRKIMRKVSKNVTYILHPHDLTFYSLSHNFLKNGLIPIDKSRVSWKNALLGPRSRKCWILRRSDV